MLDIKSLGSKHFLKKIYFLTGIWIIYCLNRYIRVVAQNTCSYFCYLQLSFIVQLLELPTMECYIFSSTHNYYYRHHHISVMELGHLLTRSGLTYPEVSSKVCHDSFRQLENCVSLPWVIYYVLTIKLF